MHEPMRLNCKKGGPQQAAFFVAGKGAISQSPGSVSIFGKRELFYPLAGFAWQARRGPLEEDSSMTSTTDKIKGVANQAAGSIKQAVGKAIDNQQMEGEGIIQKGKGKAQEIEGDAKSAIKKVIDRA